MITSFHGKHRFLSNFWPVRVIYLDIEFPSVEHAYVASKLEPDQRSTMIEISKLEKPGQAKRLGRTLALREDWEQVKFRFMEGFVSQKFSPAMGNSELAEMLLATKDMELIEGNAWGDKIWGAVWNEKTKEWEGDNALGLILMKKRKELKQ